MTDELKVLYGAENQLLKALPRMANKASSSQLKDAFTGHVKETERQVKRLQLGEPFFNGGNMDALFANAFVLAAAGYSLVYLLGGGGLGGAVLIFIVAKMLGK